jgi:ubiquinone biosynthesis protein COQ9
MNIDNSNNPLTARKHQLLAVMLEEVAFGGWNNASLQNAARHAGLSAGEQYACFPGGVPDVMAFWQETLTFTMQQDFRGADTARLKVREKVALALRLRLAAQHHHRAAVRAAAGWYSLPQNLPKATSLHWQAADAVWWLVGETQTDWNFYSKRLLLAGVHASALLYWLQDESAGAADTAAFIERRLDTIMQLGSLKRRLTKAMPFAAAGAA